MTGPLASFGKAWAEFVDELSDQQVSLLRRMATDLDHDTHAMRAVEGARDWRDLQKTGDRYAD